MSLRVELTSSNMDLVMATVREYDCNPSDAINLLLNLIKNDARSDNDGKGYEGLTCKK